jgi:hypothetical protein
LSSSHGEVFISLKDKEKKKIPESYKETILNFTEGGFKEEEAKEKPKETKRTEEPRSETRREEPRTKTIKD